MAHIYADRVRDTTTTTGTGAVTLSGTAPTGFQTFLAAVGNGNTVYYTIAHLSAAEWETGLGTLSGGTTLTRTQVLASSNAGAAVNFSAGAKEVFGTVPGAFFRETLGRSNLVINPHGSIQQETTSAVALGLAGAYQYFADQWYGQANGSALGASVSVVAGTASAYDVQQMQIQTTTAKASLAAADYALIGQPFEGLQIRRLLYGTASARGSWLRLRIVSSTAGTVSVAVRNAALNRSFVSPLAVTTGAADYYVYVPGDITGTWPTTNAAAAHVTLCHASGVTGQTSTLNAWQAGNFFAANTQSNGLDTNTRTLTLTDVQWSVHPLLLPFEPTDLQPELARCQRYWETGPMGFTASAAASGNGFGQTTQYLVEKRANPTITFAGTTYLNASGISSGAVNPNTRAIGVSAVSAGAGAVNFLTTWTANARTV